MDKFYFLSLWPNRSSAWTHSRGKNFHPCIATLKHLFFYLSILYLFRTNPWQVPRAMEFCSFDIWEFHGEIFPVEMSKHCRDGSTSHNALCVCLALVWATQLCPALGCRPGKAKKETAAWTPTSLCYWVLHLSFWPFFFLTQRLMQEELIRTIVRESGILLFESSPEVREV